jgi:hypothetical protein
MARLAGLLVLAAAATAQTGRPTSAPAWLARPESDRVLRTPDDASPAEQEALDWLSGRIHGAVVYARSGRVRKVVLGDGRAMDLGPGQYARWGPRGERVAVWHKGRVCVVRADGTGRRELARDARRDDGCPIEFHPDGREILYLAKGGFRAVGVDGGPSRPLKLPGRYTGAPCLSADGSRMVARRGQNLFAIDLRAGTDRKYARGCSPGVSPDGRRLVSNVGGHRRLAVRPWGGGKPAYLHMRAPRGDREWDNHHWSNHADYIAAQGEGGPRDAYVVCISADRSVRVTWCGKVGYPDLFVARDLLRPTSRPATRPTSRPAARP